MQLEYNPFTTSDPITMKYCTVLTNSRQLCTVCKKDEPEDTTWHRYQLPCGHIAHTRCLRNWLDEKDVLNCPVCGDMEKRDESDDILETELKFASWDRTRVPWKGNINCKCCLCRKWCCGRNTVDL